MITNRYYYPIMKVVKERFFPDMQTRKRDTVLPVDFNYDVRDMLSTLSASPVVWNVNRVYKNEWKLMPQLLNRNTDVIFIGASYDEETDTTTVNELFYKKANGEGVMLKAGSLTETIQDIHYGMKRKHSVMREQLEKFVHEHYDNPERVMDAVHVAFGRRDKHDHIHRNERFDTQLDTIVRGLDIETDLFREIEYRYTVLDIFYMKMFYALWWKSTGCDLTFVREFRGTDNGVENENPKEEAEKFVDAVKRILKMDIDVDDIYYPQEVQSMDEEFMELLRQGALS